MGLTSAQQLNAACVSPTQMEHKSAYDRDGFLCVPSLLSKSDVDTLKHEVAAICRGSRGALDGIVKVDAAVKDEDVIKRYLAFHHPHKLSPVSSAATHVGTSECARLLRFCCRS